MSQESIHVQVVHFSRNKVGEAFNGQVVREYNTIIDPDMTHELPVKAIKQDRHGNTLEYMGCLVARNRPAAVAAAEEAVVEKPKRVRKPKIEAVETPKPVRKARSVVAKPVSTPEPAPEPVKPARVNPARTKKPVETPKPERVSVKAQKGPVDLSALRAYLESR